ncbi:hypothetical protein E8E11_005262 [Didymella keratinophila]|nr:hypothetical protein E8E11_005262 [Didymella keratinophila]
MSTVKSGLNVPAPADLSVCQSPAPAAPISSLGHSDSVIVRVTNQSKSTKDYVCFRKLLSYHSSFFAAALDSASPFSIDSSQYLDVDGNIDVFDVFYGWLYTGRLKDAQGTNTADDLHLSFKLLCKVWVFADFRGVSELGNRTMDMLHERCVAEWRTPVDCVRYVY